MWCLRAGGCVQELVRSRGQGDVVKRRVKSVGRFGSFGSVCRPRTARGALGHISAMSAGRPAVSGPLVSLDRLGPFAGLGPPGGLWEIFPPCRPDGLQCPIA